MPKRDCDNYSDIISILNGYDENDKKFVGVDLTKPSQSKFTRIVQRIGKMQRSADSPVKQSMIKKAIIREYGKYDVRYDLATRIVGLLEAHPGLEDIMEEYIGFQTMAMEDRAKVSWSLDDIGQRKLDLYNLPKNVLNNILNELQSRIRYGYGENIGKAWLKGIFGPLDAQIITPKTMTRKDSSGALFAMRKEIRDFPRKQAQQISRFTKGDYKKEYYVKNSAGKKVLRTYGIEKILKNIEAIATDITKSNPEFKLRNPEMILQDMFVWHNVRDDFYNRRLAIDKDGNMTIATQYGAAYDENGFLIQWDKEIEGLKVRTAKYIFSDYIPVKEYYNRDKNSPRYVPMDRIMIGRFKEETRRYEELHMNVWDFLNKEFKQAEEGYFKELKTLVPPSWTKQDLVQLLKLEDLTKFNNKKTGASWSDLTEKQQDLLLILHKHATKYSILTPFIFNAKHEGDGLGEGRKSFPIVYNPMKFSLLWDDMIAKYDAKEEEIKSTLKLPRMKKPETIEDKTLKHNLLQELKEIQSLLKRAKWIRDRKDDYPTDMSTGTVLALGEDSKHFKHITNAFPVTQGRSDKGAYYSYLKHNMAGLERNRLTTALIQNLKRAESPAVQDYMLNLYKTALYHPDAASGFGVMKFDSESWSQGFRKVGLNISSAKIDRKTRQILSYISGTFLRGWATAGQNYTAISQKFFDMGMKRVQEAIEEYSTGGKALEDLITLSGVVDFREFFSRSLTDDANNLGGDNKNVIHMTVAMIKYWKGMEKAKTGKEKLALKKKLEDDLGKEIRSIKGKPVITPRNRLEKRLKIFRDTHRTNILRKWVDYAINKEYEAAPYVKNIVIKKGMRIAEIWAGFQKRHLPTMGKTESDLRSLSFIIGVRSAMNKGYIDSMPLNQLIDSPENLDNAIAIGVNFVEMMDFGMSRQDLGQIGNSNIGAFLTGFKVWSIQKFAKDIETIRAAHQDLKVPAKEIYDEDGKVLFSNNHINNIKAIGQMLESLVRFKKYNQKTLRTVSPKLAAFRAWAAVQVLWTTIWDLAIMGPLAFVPGVRTMMNQVPGMRTIGGSTSDLVSWMLLLPSIAIALAYGEGDDDLEKIADWYSRKTVFGFGAKWTVDTFLAMALALEEFDEEDWERMERALAPILKAPGTGALWSIGKGTYKFLEQEFF